TMTNVTGINTRTYRDQQIFINESLGLFHEKLILVGGVSKNWFYSANRDQLLNKEGHVAPEATLPNYGAVFKITPGISAYYGFSKQATAVNPTVTAASNNTNAFTTQTSQQNEFGLRFKGLEDRFHASLAYFDIKQNNFAIPNPLNSAVPVPSPLLPSLFFNRIAKGYELEFNYAVSKNFSLVGNATTMTNRDADNMPFRGTAEKSGAIWLNYIFDKGTSLNGLSAGIGVDYLSRRAGDNAGGATSASTPDKVIRQQPSFWLPERTLVNANVTYRFNNHWRAQVNLDNLLNEEYLQSSTGRQNVWVGTPFNAKLTVTFSF
ncbi:MAG TPA: TonB-dependent receptor, partial [Candidatus Didemnitutus sp.]|nr:TonB-dependent receptor [Candidatus Didemnitutus sp.]